MRNGVRAKHRTKAKQEEAAVEAGSGNVFADLGLPNAEEDLAKAKIVRRIHQTINARGLTQSQAAEVLGIDQPKVSGLIRGRFGGFSMERLFRFLNALDQDVDIVIRPARSARGAAITRVIAGNPV